MKNRFKIESYFQSFRREMTTINQKNNWYQCLSDAIFKNSISHEEILYEKQPEIHFAIPQKMIAI